MEANLKGGARHIYAKRVLRMDEDSNQMSGGEMYDGRGELWRIQEIDRLLISARGSNLLDNWWWFTMTSSWTLFGLGYEV